jgi:trans-aconitate methyltransferase
MGRDTKWDAELYEARHGFVWQLGSDVLKLLNPQRDERILDLGCGTGQLTQKIAESGAKVIGLDSSADMVGQARQNYPNIQFVLQDATKLNFREEFDAVFSNAVLHWIKDPVPAIRGINQALRPGGRMVVEFGGQGNIGDIEQAVRAVLASHTEKIPDSPWFYPSIGEYAPLLEANGFEVVSAELFDRPTPLEGEDGMKNWLQQFATTYLSSIENPKPAQLIPEIVDRLRSSAYRDGQWFADYRRLRVIAIKSA